MYKRLNGYGTIHGADDRRRYQMIQIATDSAAEMSVDYCIIHTLLRHKLVQRSQTDRDRSLSHPSRPTGVCISQHQDLV